MNKIFIAHQKVDVETALASSLAACLLWQNPVGLGYRFLETY